MRRKEEKNQSMEEAAPKSMLGKIWSAFTWLLVAVVVLIAMALVGVRLFGFKPFAVLSPSMTPKYGVGDLVYALPTDPEEIEVGDVLTFVANAEGTIVTHRVAEVDRENRCFYTKGDANESRDGNPVVYENAVGVVRFSLPKMGYVSSYLTSESGRYAAIAAVLALILLMILPELFKPSGKKETGKEKSVSGAEESGSAESVAEPEESGREESVAEPEESGSAESTAEPQVSGGGGGAASADGADGKESGARMDDFDLKELGTGMDDFDIKGLGGEREEKE